MAGTTDSVTTLSCRPPDDVGGACVTPSCCRLDLGPLHPAWRFRNPLSHASTALAVWPHSFCPHMLNLAAWCAKLASTSLTRPACRPLCPGPAKSRGFSAQGPSMRRGRVVWRASLNNVLVRAAVLSRLHAAPASKARSPVCRPWGPAGACFNRAPAHMRAQAPKRGLLLYFDTPRGCSQGRAASTPAPAVSIPRLPQEEAPLNLCPFPRALGYCIILTPQDGDRVDGVRNGYLPHTQMVLPTN